MQDFRKLDIYKRAMQYCTDIYKFSSSLPVNERYGLVSQIRRAATSIPLNISEGAGCSTNKEFALFVSYSYRSCNEVLTCLQLVKELDLCTDRIKISELENRAVQLSRMIYSFFRKQLFVLKIF